MRIACLQFAPQLANVDHNIERADAILERADPQDIDLLVLPELAFSGYNFKSLGHISPHLELKDAGISAAWSRQAALKYDSVVVTGYPERVDPKDGWPTDPKYYNSAIIMDGDGDAVGNYRKSHLYYTDETWALEGRSGFYTANVHPVGRMALGICMDINPYKFEAPWEDYEFSNHALESGASLVVLSMAWSTHIDQNEFFRKPAEPDMDTLLYWITRLQPIISAESNRETIVVFGNRCGAEGDATYVGTSAVIGIKSGEILLYGILGRDEESLLVIDTDDVPYARLKLQSRESVPEQDQSEHTLAPQLHHQNGPRHHPRNAHDSGKDNSHRTVMDQRPSTDVQEHTVNTIVVTRGPERDPQYHDRWMAPSRQPREHSTSGPFRVDGSSVGISSSNSRPSYNRFTQSYVAAPVTYQHGEEKMRPTMSEGHYNLLEEFSDSDESIISQSYPESDEEPWPRTQESQVYDNARRRNAASAQREYGMQDTSKRCPTAHQQQAGPHIPQPEQDAASESSLVQRISAVALEDKNLPSSNTQYFQEQDIYKYVHGENLTSEHHIRYHTHLLRERRARQGLPADIEDDKQDQEEWEGQQEVEPVVGARAEYNEPINEREVMHDAESDSIELPILVPASPNRLRAGADAQPNYTFGSVQSRQAFWQENPPEPTPIADTPMSHMTQFSQTRPRRRHDRQAPALYLADQAKRERQAKPRDPTAEMKTADSRADAIRTGSIPELAAVDGNKPVACNEPPPALNRSKAKENLLPLQDPSRRPKAATRQVPPLRLVPREAPQEKKREREVRERSRRTPRQMPIAREVERPSDRDKGREKDSRDKGRTTPVPMVLVYEEEGESMPASRQRY